MRLTMQNFYFVLLALTGALAISDAERCATLKSLKLENTTIVDATHVPAGTNITTTTTEPCLPDVTSTASVCRVQAVVNTTAESAVRFEAWLPDKWFGRVLAIGNGGLGGCIDYFDLDYGSTLHFASIASNNGHNGAFDDGAPFLNHPEVINDFAFRAIHVETLIGKQIVNAYYQRPHDKSYYIGCSTGGRQGIQSALRFPDDFDGILAGSPATDFNHLVGWTAMLGRFVGAPDTESKKFIPAELWPIISKEILNQCDELDGVRDGIITDPDECQFRPETLLCNATKTQDCLSAPQVSALRKIYEPLLGTQGQLLYPKYDLSGEADGNFVNMFSGEILTMASAWFKNVIFNDTNFSFNNFSIKDVEFGNAINPGGIATWDGDLSAFRNRGGKLITYHGRRDELISSDNSIRLYKLISSTLSLPSLDDFYRLFLIPGMNHCYSGPGAYAFGQPSAGVVATNQVNDTDHNALLALVDWVEGGRAPDEIVGSVPGKNKTSERRHCRYPHRSVFDGKAFVCK